MPSLRALADILLGLLLLAVPANATWSILIVDTATGEVAIGIATCLTGFDLRPSTVVVVPGYGVAAAQSFVGPLSLRQLIREQLRMGTPPNQILGLRQAADAGHQSRQYGIASVLGGTATFTGTGAGAYAGGLTGQFGTLVYTVQGNVLTGAPVVSAAEQAILTTNGTVADKLMAAMEAARAMGGDGRCSCSTGTTACGSPPASFTKSSHIGLMIVSRPGDIDPGCNGNLGCGAGQYYLDLNIANQQQADPDPVLQLQALYNAWRAQQQGRPDHFTSTVTMSGNHIRANGVDSVTGTIVLRDAQGNQLGTGVPMQVSLHPDSTVQNAIFSQVVPQANGTYTFTMRGDLDAGTALLDVTADDGLGRVRISPAPVVIVDTTFGDCGDGAIADGNGGSLDAVQVDGNAGGEDRIVDVLYGQPFSLTIDPPANQPNTAPVGAFALWAHLDRPSPYVEFPIPAGGGSLCFLPTPLNPGAPTVLVADSFGLGGAFFASRAPYRLEFPGLPALLNVTLQGVMMTDPQGTLSATNALLLRVQTLPDPTILQVTPASPLPGQAVTVHGSNFYVGAQASLNGTPLPTTRVSDSMLSFQMPTGFGCDSSIQVQNLVGATASAALNATPVIVNQLIPSGPAAGGSTYVLTGRNFLGCSITINGAPLNIISQSFGAITGLTPPGAPGPATVLVQNPNGCQDTVTYTYF